MNFHFFLFVFVTFIGLVSHTAKQNVRKMKKGFIIASMLMGGITFAQEGAGDPDTTRMKVGKNTEVLIIQSGDEDEKDSLPSSSEFDTIDVGPEEPYRNNEAHWAGIDLGMNINTNGSGSDKFGNYTYWENDPLKSFYFNVNFAEKKIKIIKEYVGITTGVGFNFNQIGFQSNFVLADSSDTITAFVSPTNYSKNKLRAAYLQIPLMLEFNTNKDNENGVYLAAGVIGGVRLASRTKRVYEVDGKEVKEKIKGVYALNPFKLDATARIGYGDWGAFANYSIIPLFDTDKTTAVHPISFGLSYSF